LLDAPACFCYQCKTIIESVERLLFVEEETNRGFCSEECIEEFFRPLMEYYRDQSDSYRKKLNLDENVDALKIQFEQYFEDLFENPSEIWKLENDLGEALYFMSSQAGKDGPYLIALVTLFSGSVSFVYFTSISYNLEFLNFFRVGTKIEELEKVFKMRTNMEKELMEEFASDIEMIKSELLADLLMNHQETDIDAEKYSLYDRYMQVTMDGPDDAYRYPAKDGSELLSVIKAFEVEGKSFYYIVTCLIKSVNIDEDESEILIPVLGFPTVDGKLCSLYRKGTQVIGALRS